MDAKEVIKVINDEASFENLSTAERLAIARLQVVRVKVHKPPTRFLLPPKIERLFRGWSI